MNLLNLLCVIVPVIIFLFLLFFLFWKYIFLRDPERKIPAGRNLVSPADGRVIEVMLWGRRSAKLEKRFFGKISLLCSDVASSCRILSIFMSPLDVHVNRVPCDAEVLYLKHSKGSFGVANRFNLDNEKNEVLLKTSFGRIKVVQVAGFVARRIECWIQKNQKVVKGQRFGRINLGSQVIVVMPSHVDVVVKPGDRLKAGKSIIAAL